MNTLGRLLAEKALKDKLKELTDYIERVNDEDLFALLGIVNELIERGKPVKTQRINYKGEIVLI